MFRILRILRLMRSSKGLQDLIMTMVLSFPSLVNVTCRHARYEPRVEQTLPSAAAHSAATAHSAYTGRAPSTPGSGTPNQILWPSAFVMPNCKTPPGG